MNETVKINVEKNNGIKERFSYEKLMKSLIMVETPFFESDKIIATVVSQLYDGIKTKEIKYFDESENVWKIGRVIVDEVLGL